MIIEIMSNFAKTFSLVFQVNETWIAKSNDEQEISTSTAQYCQNGNLHT